MPITKYGEYSISVKLNQIELQTNELSSLRCVSELGNIMATCFVNIVTERYNIFRNSLYEMSLIEVEIASLGKNNSMVNKKKMRYFLSNADIKQSTFTGKESYTINLFGVVDAWKYLGYANLRSAKTRESSPKFLSELTDYFSSGAKGTGTFSMNVKDGLLGKATDVMYWVQPDITGIDMVNQLLVRPVLKTKGNKLNDNRNFTYTSVIDFNDSGNPEINFYDLRLRTSSFSPPSTPIRGDDGSVKSVPLNFVYKHADKGEDGVNYTDTVLDIKGADYSALYWQRTASIFDMEEGEYKVMRIKQPKLFSDSQEYSEQQLFHGDSPPSDYTMFTNYSRWNTEWYNSNHYNMHYAMQKFQITANLLALRKVNITVQAFDQILKVKPIDICKIHVRKGKSGDGDTTPKDVDDTKLSGKYMVTKVEYIFKNGVISTRVTGSRDSFIG